jgi:tol-pal system protein YbgF
MREVDARAVDRTSRDVRAVRRLSVITLPWPRSVGALAVIGIAACGRAPTQSDRAIAQLRADLTRISLDQRQLLTRLTAVEASQARCAVGHTPKEGAAGPEADPQAGVTTGLGPARATEAGGPSSEGTASHGGEQVSDPSSRSTKGEKPAPALARTGAKREYDAALALLNAKSYDSAIEGLTAFLVRYPDHPHAENAMYWRGEAFQAKGEYARAVQEYEGLIARFPFGTRTAEALLGLGICEQKLGQGERAEQAFAELRERYPKSTAAHKVPGR